MRPLRQLYMMMTLFACMLLTLPGISFAQDVTVDEILDNYFENTGGKDAWRALKGVKMMAKVSQGGGMEIPLEIVQFADGRQYTKVTVQGMNVMQGVFDGTTLWNTNFQTMKPEKADAELTEVVKLNANDFPDGFLDYKEKGYTVELQGMETIDGTETYKVKLVKEPVTIDGAPVDDISYYFFDTENFVPIATESEVKMGPQKGVISQTTFSDYQEVGGLYFAFSFTQGIKDGPSQPFSIDSIELNPEVDDAMFAFPEEQEDNKDK